MTYLIATGVLADADATFTALLEHGEQANLSDAAAVPDEELIRTEVLASFTFADDNKARKLGYRGAKRYTRLTITPTNNTAAAPITIIPVLGHPRIAPTANPPV